MAIRRRLAGRSLEIMLRDASHAHGMGHVILRYLNVAGTDPRGRAGQSTPAATHSIKVAAETALELRPKLEIFGTDYPTPDGTCIRDYIHVSDLAKAHLLALRYLRSGGAPLTLNCGYGHGFSVREVIETVKRVSGIDFEVATPRREGDPARIVAASARIRDALGWCPPALIAELFMRVFSRLGPPSYFSSRESGSLKR
jgi:UDP-glucose 4-epimerase